jgi:hypothetical protein
MGIDNIEILMNPDGPDDEERRHIQALAVYQQELVMEHRRGDHPYGAMIRACPLCQAS